MKTTEPTPILCGTDLSHNVAQAATAAAALTSRSRRPLVLVHVADELNAPGGDTKNLAAFLRPVRKQFRAEAERLRKAGATVEEKLLHGSVAEQAIMELGENVRQPWSWFLPSARRCSTDGPWAVRPSTSRKPIRFLR